MPWIAGDGELSAVNSQSTTVDLLSIDGASSVQILGGSGQNSLSVQSLSAPTAATISGNNVTLVTGVNVLNQTNFNTYNDFSDLNQLINFSGLKASTSYTDALASGSFTLTPTGSLPISLMGTTHNNLSVTNLSSTADLYVGEAVTGTGIPSGTTIAKINSMTAITLSLNATNGSNESLTFSETVLKAILNGTTSVTGLLSTADLYVDEPVMGTGIPTGTIITAINSNTAITLSQAATVPTPENLTFLDSEIVLIGALHGTTSVTGLPSTADLVVGQTVTGTGIRAGTTIAAINSTTFDHLEPGRDDEHTVEPGLPPRVVAEHDDRQLRAGGLNKRYVHAHGHAVGELDGLRALRTLWDLARTPIAIAQRP